MSTEIHAAQPVFRPPAAAAASEKGAVKPAPLPDGPVPVPASLPGLGSRIDLYDSAGKREVGFYGGGKSAGNFPYLKPIPGPEQGNLLNTLI